MNCRLHQSDRVGGFSFWTLLPLMSNTSFRLFDQKMSIRYNTYMTTQLLDTNLDEYLKKSDRQSTDVEYLDWKKHKTLKGIEQAEDRSSMIPMAKVWESLSIEH